MAANWDQKIIVDHIPTGDIFVVCDEQMIVRGPVLLEGELLILGTGTYFVD